jgi:RNA polymerase sigma-70 factor (ECF subfamily)
MELERERALVEAAKSDLQAFGLLYDEYYPRVFGYALRRTASVTAAQDVTSEVFYKALRGIRGFRWHGVPFSAWLYRIAGHEISNYYTRDGRRKLLAAELSVFAGVSQDSVETEIEQAERSFRAQQDLLALQAALQKLPPRYQEVISLRYFEKKGLAEISGIIGKNEGAVKSLLHRSLEKMRSLMRPGETF